MRVSYFAGVRKFKSRVRVVAACLLRSCDVLRARLRNRCEENADLRLEIKALERSVGKLEQQVETLQRESAQVTAENQRLREQPPRWPNDPPLAHHQFGVIMIALCINLARKIGFRAVPVCLEIVFQSLRVCERIPDWTTVRQWMLRAGVAKLEEPIERADDWILFADHSNQIGQEKLLVIQGIRQSQLPPPGQSLRHEDMHVLTVQPGVSWKAEDVAKVYEAVADKFGTPLALVTDGASELRDAAQVFVKRRPKMIVLRDFKHMAANLLKKVLGQTERFDEFKKQMGSARASIQQTELGHFTPPGLKSKARFMNLQPTLTWALMIFWQLRNPTSRARRGISAERMEEKLGWITTYERDLKSWCACQEVISTSLTLINQQGLSDGLAEKLEMLLRPLTTCETSRTVASELVTHVNEAEASLPKGLRLPLSTEILESSFGLFKQLEGQHSKGGFTSLIAAFPIALTPVTPQSVELAFARVTSKKTTEWVKEHLKTTLTARRTIAYNESKPAKRTSQIENGTTARYKSTTL